MPLPESLIPATLPVTPKRSKRVQGADEVRAPPEEEAPEEGAAPPEEKAAPEEGAAPPEEEAAPPEEGVAPPEEEAAPEANTASSEASNEIIVYEDLQRTKTLRELKEMCLERSLPTHGKKMELVRRIEEHDVQDKS